jgi:hypothetical protein
VWVHESERVHDWICFTAQIGVRWKTNRQLDRLKHRTRRYGAVAGCVWRAAFGRQTDLDIISVARCQLCCPVDGFLPARMRCGSRGASFAPVRVLKAIAVPSEVLQNGIYIRRLTLSPHRSPTSTCCSSPTYLTVFHMHWKKLRILLSTSLRWLFCRPSPSPVPARSPTAPSSPHADRSESGKSSSSFWMILNWE